MKLKITSFVLAMLSAFSFAAQAQNAAKSANTANGNLKIEAAGTQAVDLKYNVSSDASEDIKLDMNLLQNETTIGLKARVMNSDGKEVLAMSDIPVSGHLVKVLNTSELAPGAYVIELSGTGKTDAIQRIAFMKGPGGILITETN